MKRYKKPRAVHKAFARGFLYLFKGIYALMLVGSWK